MRQILATGSAGQVGTELRRYAWPEGWELVALDIDELDLRDTAAIAAKVAERPWAAVINAGAYTAVDQAETDVVMAWAVNALAPAAFAAACSVADIPLIQISTDYVFDGLSEHAWEETDSVCPISVYGASKLGGELAIRTGHSRHVILRTAWVVSAHGTNFVKTMLRLGSERTALRVINDQHGTPTAAADLAGVLATIAIQLARDPAAPTGTFHFTNAGATTWHDFAKAIFVGAARRGARSPALEAIATKDYPTAARRPANSVLNQTAIRTMYGISARPWEAALEDILDELLGPV